MQCVYKSKHKGGKQMEEKQIGLTQAEWSVMECLWEAGPLTEREVTRQM